MTSSRDDFVATDDCKPVTEEVTASTHQFRPCDESGDAAPKELNGLTTGVSGNEPHQVPPEDDASAEPSRMVRERDLGPQPIADLMKELGIKPHDLVAASTEQITHKMVSRAMKGRWLTRNTMNKVIQAFNSASGQHRKRSDLFNY
ncbi:MAG: hypothetical protein KDA91_19160 [Planctomycetaceae bacterium]|nr:hypothetical protein [Planctomycetaceae bacterium]